MEEERPISPQKLRRKKQEQAEVLQDCCTELEKVASENSTLRSELERLTKELETLKAQLAKKDEEYRALLTEVNELLSSLERPALLTRKPELKVLASRVYRDPVTNTWWVK